MKSISHRVTFVNRKSTGSPLFFYDKKRRKMNFIIPSSYFLFIF